MILIVNVTPTMLYGKEKSQAYKSVDTNMKNMYHLLQFVIGMRSMNFTGKNRKQSAGLFLYFLNGMLHSTTWS